MDILSVICKALHVLEAIHLHRLCWGTVWWDSLNIFWPSLPGAMMREVSMHLQRHKDSYAVLFLVSLIIERVLCVSACRL